MSNYTPLREGGVYHIYNMGNNGENIFIEERNYRHFLRLLFFYLYPVCDVFAFCLMRNHFHLLIRVLTEAEWRARVFLDVGAAVDQVFDPARRLGDAFNAYAKAVNKAYNRSGSLFRKPFRRKEIKSDAHFAVAVRYIHRNPEHHGFVGNFRDWPWSSYAVLASSSPTSLKRADVLEWFGGASGFAAAHVLAS